MRAFTIQSLISRKRDVPHKPYLCKSFTGRLGNLIFEYASLVGIARMKDMIPVIPQDSSLLKVFKLNISTVSKQACETFKHHGERRPSAFDEGSITFGDGSWNYTLSGHFQSWRYFKNSQGDLKRQLTFRDEILSKAKTNLLNLLPHCDQVHITTTNITFVGVHVRRGDIISKRLIEFGVGTATREYFLHAMNLFRQRYNPVLFVVCSNDMKWSQANITGSDVVFSPAQKPEVDLATLSLCNHTIMSVGSYGWWAAWLAGGTTVYYKYQYRENSKLASQFNMSDYMYPDWIGME